MHRTATACFLVASIGKCAVAPLLAAVLTSALITTAPAAAQSVPIKTIPVAEGHQFLFFPSERMAMGGIALHDRYADPFVNPARTVNLDGVRFVSAPVYYGFGPLNGRDGDGSGRTLPFGAMMRHEGLFGGAMFAYQELIPGRPPQVCCAFAETSGGMTVVEQSELSRNNLYVFGLGGTELPGGDWSVGVSVFHGSLHGLEGVQRLYASNSLRQEGSIQQFRIGAYYDAGQGHAADLVLLHHRLDMTHTMSQGQDTRTEYDRTMSVALQSIYRYEFPTGWTLGGQLTGDWKWHPKIPNYDLMNIPRDPGNSAAYNVGIGLATTSGPATFAMDFIFEPIWSHTWADAAEAVETASGEIIPSGDKTVDNRFDFRNAQVRMGLFREGERVDFAVGLHMHHISYDLDQMDFVEEQRRLLDNRWTEWTISSGIGTDLSSFRLQYSARLTLGTGTPGVRRPWGLRGDAASFADAGIDWVVAPDGPLALEETAVLTHQIALMVPLVP